VSKNADGTFREKDCCDECCVKCGGFCGLEELTRAGMIDEDEGSFDVVAEYGSESEAALRMRREASQIIKMVRYLSMYFVVLTFIYVIQTVYCWKYIKESDFEADGFTEVTAKELYEYSVDLEVMKIFHSLSLLGISIYLVSISRGYRVLHETHYWRLLTISVLFTILYFIPVIYIGCYVYNDSQKEGRTNLH